MAHTLWTTEDSLRWFLVPGDAAWPDGSDTVQDVLGDRRRVDLARLAAHEVDAERARAWSEAETARLEAELDAAGVQRPAVPPQVHDVMKALESGRARELLQGFGLDADRVLGDREHAARLIAEVVLHAARAAGDPRFRAGALEDIAGVLEKHGHPEAARKVRSAPATLRPFLEELEGELRRRSR